MKPALTENLERALRANPRAKAAQLCAMLGIDQSTLSRALRKLSGKVVTLGKASRTRYSWHRTVRGYASEFPIYRIDRSGAGYHSGGIQCIYPSGTAVRLQAELGWPADEDMKDGWYEGLPYWLVDMKPQGFLGRNFAKRYAQMLHISDDPIAWSDDDILHILATVGSDQAGNLILGDAAYEMFLQGSRRQESLMLDASHIEEAYPRLALEALALGQTGSSAGGEFPKFTVCRTVDGEPRHAIVKFSGAGASPAENRWADLLVCEHIALNCMREHLRVPAARSMVYRYAGRTFLEIERFDRHGLLGRSEVCSLSSINAALVGSAETGWPAISRSLRASGFLDEQQANVVDSSWWFGRLIGNSDMHLGNLSFVPGLVVAPAYDMLPMMYSPLRGGELPGAVYAMPEPLPRERGTWQKAAGAAVEYWRQCASDSRVSDGFRAVCKENSSLIERELNSCR